MELESFVCELDKKIAENGAILGQKEIALKHALRALSEAQMRWKLHQGNRKHVKNKAGYVDFREYKGSLKVREQAKGDLDDALFKVSQLKSDVKYYKNKVTDAEADRKRIKKELAEYGQVIQFRRTA